MYEDDGLTNEYTHTFAFIHVDMETTEDGIKLSIQRKEHTSYRMINSLFTYQM
ncbi:DUF5110 domain-containing protein [Bacillus licheniformis]|nr:DUF5110 domain-containing protein [Bacillus licheniformis]